MSATTEHATGDTCAPCTAILGSPSACAISHDFRPGAYDRPAEAPPRTMVAADGTMFAQSSATRTHGGRPRSSSPEPLDATALAAEIAARFGETGDRPRAQIARMIGLMGAAWVRNAAHMAGLWHGTRATAASAKSGAPRTPGGTFFAAARSAAQIHVEAMFITRRDFFRCFTDRPPQPRTPKAPPVKAPKLPRMPAGAHVTAGNVWRQPARAAVPEVYVVRGRAGAGR